MVTQIRVLHVDDDPDLAELVATFLEREDDRIVVDTAENATAGLAHIDIHELDCVVSDHDMPGPNGIEFLRTVRERFPELPFILYTGKGSEAVASDAISAGVTDYLQKGGGTEQYEMLAKRLVEAVEKRRLEAEAERTRAHLEAVTDHSMDAIVTIDADSTIRFANPAVERLFGHEPAELVGEPLATLMADGYAERHRDALERYLSTGERTMDWGAVEFPGVHREGREISLSISFGAFEEGGEQRFVGIVRDVTERERHRAFVEHSGDIVSVLDADGAFRYISPSVERILGHNPEELVGTVVFEYIHPDDRDAARDAFYGGSDLTTVGSGFECRVECADGEYRWLESVGTDRLDDHAVGGYVINARDISDRKRREEKLAQLREWTRQLNYTRTVEETTRLAVNAADEIVGGELSGIHLVNDVGDRLEPEALAKSVPAFFDEQPSYERDAPAGSRAALAWEAYRVGEPTAIGELSASDRLDEETPAESIVLHPIGDHGLFVISASTADAFTDTDVLIAEILANHLKTALDRVERESRLEGLHDATRSLVRAESRGEIAGRVVDAAADVLDFSVVTVREHDEEAGGLVPLAVSESVKEMLPERSVFTPDSGSLNWGAFEAGETRVYDDIQTLDTLDDGTDLRSLMILPIGEYGTIAIGETMSDAFDDTDEFLTGILATAAETAFQSATRTRRLHERSAELERQNDRLAEFASVVSHDLRNRLNVAQGRVELAREERANEHLDAAAGAHDRMEALISDLLTLARQGEAVSETDPTPIAAVVEGCWQNVETAGAELSVETDMVVRADESRLQQLFENLIRNSVEHGSTGSRTQSGDSVEHGSTSNRTQSGDSVEHGSTSSRTQSGDSVEHGSTSNRTQSGDSVEHDSTGSRTQSGDNMERDGDKVTVTVGETDSATGFFVADDGPGIPPDKRERVFESGYSTSGEGTGFGLRIVKQVAEAHGWNVRATAAQEGGARFEITSIERVE